MFGDHFNALRRQRARLREFGQVRFQIDDALFVLLLFQCVPVLIFLQHLGARLGRLLLLGLADTGGVPGIHTEAQPGGEEEFEAEWRKREAKNSPHLALAPFLKTRLPFPF